MFKRAARAASLAVLPFLLSGCESLILPDFNGGMLNPDIRYLKAGEVMNGVKCAMTEYMREREEQVIAERVETVSRRRENDETAKRFLLLYGSEYPSYSDTQANIYLGTIRPNVGKHEGTDNELNPYAIHLESLHSHINEISSADVDPRGGGKLAGLCWPREPGKYRHWDAVKKKCVLNAPDRDTSPDEVGSGEKCPLQIGKTIWDYTPHISNGVAASHCTTVPDYSRFALDHTQQATIELSLLATNQGTIFYDYINQSKLGVFKDIIAPGNRATGAVFPKFDITAKGSTTFDMSVQMPQTIFQAPGPSSPYESSTARSANPIPNMKQAEPATRQPSGAQATTETIMGGRTARAPAPTGTGITLEAGGGLKFSNEAARKMIMEQHPEVVLQHKNKEYKFNLDAGAKLIPSDPEAKKALEQVMKQAQAPEVTHKDGKLVIKKSEAAAKAKPKTKPAADVLTKREIELVANDLTPQKQFTSGCGGNGIMKVDSNTEIDYLKLKEVLHNVVARQNEQIAYQGGPAVALDTLTLTSSFEIVLDMSAGTNHIFRLFPMVLPPQMGVKPDHTHTLKITLHGAKQKGDAQNGKHLVAACQQRLQPPKAASSAKAASAPNGAAFCSTPAGQLLESMIEATEKSSGSGAASASTSTP